MNLKSQKTKFLNNLKSQKMENTKIIFIRKIAVLLLLTLLPTFLFSQSTFDKFEDMDGVTTVVVSQHAFKLMSDIGKDSDTEYLNLIKNITNLKMFSTENKSLSSEMENAVKQYLSKDNLTELMRVKDKGNNVKIYVKNGSDAEHVKELLMFVKSNEKGKNKGVIILLTGNIDLKQISKLTAKMNIPGGENLKKIH